MPTQTKTPGLLAKSCAGWSLGQIHAASRGSRSGFSSEASPGPKSLAGKPQRGRWGTRGRSRLPWPLACLSTPTPPPPRPPPPTPGLRPTSPQPAHFRHNPLVLQPPAASPRAQPSRAHTYPASRRRRSSAVRLCVRAEPPVPASRPAPRELPWGLCDAPTARGGGGEGAGWAGSQGAGSGSGLEGWKSCRKVRRLRGARPPGPGPGPNKPLVPDESPAPSLALVSAWTELPRGFAPFPGNLSITTSAPAGNLLKPQDIPGAPSPLQVIGGDPSRIGRLSLRPAPSLFGDRTSPHGGLHPSR